jgi:hypothetical protein
MFVAIDRTSKFAYDELHERATAPDRSRSVPCLQTTESSSQPRVLVARPRH